MCKTTIPSNFCLVRAWFGLGSDLVRPGGVSKNHHRGHTFAWFGLGSGLVRPCGACRNHNRGDTFAWFGLGSARLCFQAPPQGSHFCLVLTWFGHVVVEKNPTGVTVLLGSGLVRPRCGSNNHSRGYTSAWLGLGSGLVRPRCGSKNHRRC